MDFIGGWSNTKFGHDYLFMVVDCFSKKMIFIPCTNKLTGEGAAKLFFQHVWKHLWLFTSIISVWNNMFLSHLWKALWRIMDTRLKRSPLSICRPMADGQTKDCK